MSVTPTQDQIAQAVDEILRTHDLKTITLRIVMTMLCNQFQLPKEHLNPQKPYVRSIINDFLANNYQPESDANESGDAEADDGDNGPKGQQNSSNNNNDNDDNDDNDDEVDEPRTVSRKQASRPRGSNKANGALSKPVRLTGLERPVVLAQPLADFIGDLVIPRSHISKRISAYAKQHGLQDPNDGRKIMCDEALKTALSVDEFTFFTLQKLIAGLVYKPEECEQPLQDLAKQCEEKLIAEKTQKLRELAESAGSTNNDDASTNNSNSTTTATNTMKRPRKKQKADKNDDGTDKKPKRTGITKPMQLSAALTAVVGEDQLSRSDVLKKIWDYIRTNNLKDQNNSKRVICDEKLQAVFNGNPDVGHMDIMKFLSAHMTKIEEDALLIR